MNTTLWPTRHRPGWWHDEDVRSFIIFQVDKASVADLLKEGRQRFGDRFPSQTATYHFVNRWRAVQGSAPAMGDLELLAGQLEPTERAALAARLMMSITTPDMGPALIMGASLIRDHGRALSLKIDLKGDMDAPEV